MARARRETVSPGPGGRRRSLLDAMAGDASLLASDFPWLASLPPRVREQVESEARYAGYLPRQAADIRRFRREEALRLDGVDFQEIGGLSAEAREALIRHRPASLGAASRVQGMTPATLASILAHMRKRIAAPHAG